MDKREANIDLVFRNGLKDYEVLPPAEIWDHINPVVKRKRRSFVLLRIAAVSTIVLTTGFLAYQLGNRFSAGMDNAITALNLEAKSPLVLPQNENPAYAIQQADAVAPVSAEKRDKQLLAEALIPEKTIAPEAVPLSSAEEITLFRDEKASENKLSLRGEAKKTFITDPVELYPLEEPVVNKGKRWTIAALASPTYNSSSVSSDFSKQLMQSENQLISYTGGVVFSYKVNKRFSIESGLLYSSVGKEIEGINSFGGFQKYAASKGSHNFEVLTSTGSVLTNNSDIFLASTTGNDRILTNYTNDVFDPEKASLQYINNSLNQNLSYLELPILLRYKFIDKTLDFNLVGGLSYNLLVNNSVYTVTNDGKFPVGQTEGLNPVSISSSLGMGMEYNLSENFSLNLEPTFRYHLNPFNEIEGSNFHPYSFGIFSGLSFKF